MTALPTKEIGTTNPGALTMTGLGGSKTLTIALYDDLEYVPELVWPMAFRVFDMMANDAQIAGLLAGMMLPLTRYRYWLDPNGADDAVVQAISEDLAVPVQGQTTTTRQRSSGRFSHKKHLEQALLALKYGAMWFEIVGDVDKSTGWFRLRKLAPRMPRTLNRVNVSPNGGPVSIEQMTQGGMVEIPIERLAGFVWGQEGGNYHGKSLLRPMYANWFMKQRLMKVDGIKHERNGMGIPVMTAPTDASPAQLAELSRMARALRAGTDAGGSLPQGATAELLGVKGTLPDTVASMKYHDEQAAQAGLMMFMKLGTTAHGSRALGESFINFFANALDAIAEWYVDVMNEHVIENIVTWNAGDDAAVPLLVAERVEDAEMLVADIDALIQDGAITVDDEIENALRKRAGFAPRSDATPPRAHIDPPVTAPTLTIAGAPPVAAASHRHAHAHHAHRHDQAAPGLLARTWRRMLGRRVAMATRQPRTPVDLEQLHAEWEKATAGLVAAWPGVRAAQIDALVAQVEAADGDPVKVVSVTASAEGVTVIRDAMRAMAAGALQAYRDEAAAQGATIPTVASSDVHALVDDHATALAAVMADRLRGAAAENALRLMTPGQSPAELGQLVRDHLESLTDAFLEQKFGAAMTAAQNAGRFAGLREGPDPSEIRALELLDENTCSACSAIDDHLYETIDDAEADYGGGGYVECEGGDRCRGTIEVVYGETAPSVEGEVETA